MRRLGFLLVTVALIAGACADDPEAETTTTIAATTTTTFGGSSTSQATSTTEPGMLPTGGTLRVDLWGTPLTINPMMSDSEWENLLASNVLSGPWRLDGNTGELVPDLLTELPSVANGGLVVNPDGSVRVRYEIHPDAVWSDGVPVSGDDFAYTLEALAEVVPRMLQVLATHEAALELRTEMGGEPTVDAIVERSGVAPSIVADVLAGRYTLTDACGNEELATASQGVFEAVDIPLDSIEAGPKSFEFTLADISDYSVNVFRYVSPKHALEGTDLATDWNTMLWPSAGPYVVESYDPATVRLTLVRNENYWRTHPDTGQPLPLIDRIEVGRMPEVRQALPAEVPIVPLDGKGDPIVVDLQEYDRLYVPCGEVAAAAAVGIEDPAYREALGTAWAGANLEAKAAALADGTLVEVAANVGAFQVTDLQDLGLDASFVNSNIWEHIGFDYGDRRLSANEDSLIEHLDFRLAIAHALDRDRIAQEAPSVPTEPIDFIVEAFSPTLTVPGGLPYEYDPVRARELIGALCERLGRNCEQEPPKVVFTAGAQPARARTSELVAEMLGEVGIVVETRVRNVQEMIYLCGGWEVATWAWQANPDFFSLPDMYGVMYPGAPPVLVAPTGIENPYAWGTDALEGIVDDPWPPFIPPSPDCDESEEYNQGPSSVRDEFTERYAEVFEELQETLDTERQLQLIYELERIIADRVVIIPLYARPTGYFINDEIVGGAGKAYGPAENYWNLEQWYLKDPAG